MLLSPRLYLEQTAEELRRRRAVKVAERLSALPQPKPKRNRKLDTNQMLHRWIRGRHEKAGVCKYFTCRGKNCPRKDI